MRDAGQFGALHAEEYPSADRQRRAEHADRDACAHIVEQIVVVKNDDSRRRKYEIGGIFAENGKKLGKEGVSVRKRAADLQVIDGRDGKQRGKAQKRRGVDNDDGRTLELEHFGSLRLYYNYYNTSARVMQPFGRASAQTYACAPAKSRMNAPEREKSAKKVTEDDLGDDFAL